MCAKCFRKDWVYLVGVLDFPGTGLGSLGNWKSVRGQLVEKKPTLHLEQKCMVCKPAPFFGTKICHHHIYSKRCCGQHMLAIRDGFELEFSGSSEPELWRFRAEPGCFNFRAETELTIMTICMSKNSKFLTFFPILLLYHDFNQFHAHLICSTKVFLELNHMI